MAGTRPRHDPREGSLKLPVSGCGPGDSPSPTDGGLTTQSAHVQSVQMVAFSMFLHKGPAQPEETGPCSC